MSEPTPESRVAGPLRSLEVGSLDDQIRRAETAVIRRDQRFKRQLADATVRGQEAVHGSGMWLLAGVGTLLAVWLGYRATPGARRERRRAEEAERRAAARRDRSTRGERGAAHEQVETAKSASKLGMLGAAVTLISTVAQTFGKGPKISSPWVWLGRTAWGGVQRFRSSPASSTPARPPRPPRPARPPASSSRYTTTAAAAPPVVAKPAADLGRRSAS